MPQSAPHSVGQADLVVYASGLQDAVDQAVSTQAQDTAFDVVPAADVRPTGGSVHPDPHWWLDPARYADVTRAVADELARLDPEGATVYAQGAQAFVEELAVLDAELDEGLAGCRQPVVVTSQGAFGYLTDRYRLEQVGIAGLSPEADPARRDWRRLPPWSGSTTSARSTPRSSWDPTWPSPSPGRPGRRCGSSTPSRG